MSDETCAWEIDENGSYETTCGNVFAFVADGPSENGFEFCPYCGRELVEDIGDDGEALERLDSGRLHSIIADATKALGPAWMHGGASLAEGIARLRGAIEKKRERVIEAAAIATLAAYESSMSFGEVPIETTARWSVAAAHALADALYPLPSTEVE